MPLFLPCVPLCKLLARWFMALTAAVICGSMELFLYMLAIETRRTFRRAAARGGVDAAGAGGSVIGGGSSKWSANPMYGGAAAASGASGGGAGLMTVDEWCSV